MTDTESNVLDQIGELKERLQSARPEDKEVLVEWERMIRKAMIVKDLYQHDAIKILFEFCTTKVSKIKDALEAQTAVELSSPQGLAQRTKYEAQKEAYAWFVGLFKKADDTIKVINKNVKDNLGQ